MSATATPILAKPVAKFPARDVRHWLAHEADQLASERTGRGEIVGGRAARAATSDFWRTIPASGQVVADDLLATLRPMMEAAEARVATIRNLAATVTLNAGLVNRGLATTFVPNEGAE
jgi:hypothetical protein